MTGRQPVELKAFFRDLVTACGGPKRAAQLVGAQASHISEAMAAHVPERWPRVDQVAILEADCGRPFVTAALADRLGYSVAPVATGEDAKPAVQHLATVTRETHDVVAALIDAMADGHVGEAERRQIRAQAQEAIQALHKLCADMADPAAGGNVAALRTKS